MPAIASAAQPAEFNRCLVQVFQMVRETQRMGLGYLDRFYTPKKNLLTTSDVAIAKIVDVFLAFKSAPWQLQIVRALLRGTHDGQSSLHQLRAQHRLLEEIIKPLVPAVFRNALLAEML